MVDAALWGLALAAAAASLVVVLNTDVLHSALGLIAVLLALAGVYAVLGAWFIAAVQVVVYAGAVMVLFLFALMVLESRREHPSRLASRRLQFLGAATAGGALFAALAWEPIRAARAGSNPVVPGLGPAAAPDVSRFSRTLFTDGLLPFELVGLLLLVALVAVVVLAGRREGEEAV